MSTTSPNTSGVVLITGASRHPSGVDINEIMFRPALQS